MIKAGIFKEGRTYIQTLVASICRFALVKRLQGDWTKRRNAVDKVRACVGCVCVVFCLENSVTIIIVFVSDIVVNCLRVLVFEAQAAVLNKLPVVLV